MMNSFTWITQWFWSQCDGNWEHGYGISLSTTDSSGWRLFVRILETELESVKFIYPENNFDESDKVHCFVRNGAFEGYCSSGNLFKLFDIFRKWAELHITTPLKSGDFLYNDDELYWLLQWYDECNMSHLSSLNRIDIGTLDNPGWAIDIDLAGTNLETVPFKEVEVNGSVHNWLFCSKTGHIFSGNSGPFSCLEIIKIFRNWVVENQ